MLPAARRKPGYSGVRLQLQRLVKGQPNTHSLCKLGFVSSDLVPGKTVDTLNGMLKIVDKVMPEAVILENVDAMDDGYQDIGLDHVLQVLGDRGYDPQAF